MAWPDDCLECTRCGDPAWEDTGFCTKCEWALDGQEEKTEEATPVRQEDAIPEAEVD